MFAAAAFQLYMLLATLANTLFNQISFNFWPFELPKSSFSFTQLINFDVLGTNFCTFCGSFWELWGSFWVLLGVS